MNGWRDILIEIYNLLVSKFKMNKKTILQNLGNQTTQIESDMIGDILFSSNSYSSIKYIEEILQVT